MSDLNTNRFQTPNTRRKSMIRRITSAAILTALSVILMYLEVALPLMPPFLKFDFSEIPVLIGSFALGPLYGVIIELLKNLIHLPVSATSGIGEMSNFITGSIYVGIAGLIYNRLRTRKGAIFSMLIATLCLTAIAIPLNYWVTLPLYASVLGFSTEAVIGMSAAVNSLITSKWTLIFWGFVPFNMFKGIVVAIVTFFIYKPISRLINKTYEETR
ncbi:Riboflavin transporter FmnP [Ruminococcaceae bacterium YRB3002]|nr:Riboflavin transporter FmnP [Ruminococcaceae bacterium YRB3002]